MLLFSVPMRLLPIIGLFFTVGLFAQQSGSHFPARTAGWVTLGIDGGTAFQTSDVKIDFKGYGGGLTLAKNLAYRPGALFSFDLRGRFLLTRSFGLDTKRAYGIQNNNWLNGKNSKANYLLDKQTPNDSSFVFQNFRHGMGELGLEGVLTFNQLRERTGIVLALFGGIGIDVYRTRIDQLNALGDQYNYLAISEKGGNAQIKADLANLRDGTYETTIDETNINWMPGAGIELGYQITPRFVLGIGHKITFSRTDLLDGQAWNNQNQATGNNDWNHYTNLHLRWDLQHAERKLEPPQINIFVPQTNPYLTKSVNEPLRARVLNVRGKADVVCYLNGSNQPFTLTETLLESTLYLRSGRNEVRIVASNPAGRDEANTIIIYEEPVVVVEPPVRYAPEVRIVQPARSPFATNQDNISLVADVKYVNSSRDLQLIVNGINERFSFAENLEANVRLREGSNRIVVEANTPDGRGRDEIEVIYRKETIPPVERPEVDIIAPAQGVITDQPEVLLRAGFRQVKSKDQIVVTLNGIAVRTFDFDPVAQTLRATLRIREGSNQIKVEVNTAGGQASDATEVQYKKPVPPEIKPNVEIITPAEGFVTKQQDVQLRAITRQVTAKDQLVVILNGIAARTFEFDLQGQTLRATLRLREGANKIRVEANTSGGKVFDEVNLTYKKEVPDGPRPVVTITQPQNSTESTDVSPYSIKARIENVASKSDITLLLNGVAIPDFTFEPKLQQLTAALKLNKGENKVSIKGVNQYGSGEANVTITLKTVFEPVRKPEVKILEPEEGVIVKQADLLLRASFKNVQSKEQISVSLNGKVFRLFDFDGKSLTLRANLNLREGENNISVRAVSPQGNAEATRVVQYKPAQQAPLPTIVFVQPLRAKTSVSQASYTFKADAVNINAKEQIKLTLNGTVLTNFDFYPKTGAIVLETMLKEGGNNISITVTNAGGTAEANATVDYLKAEAPTPAPQVEITSNSHPTANPYNPEEASTIVLAVVKEIYKREQITIKVNDVVLTNYTFDVKTGNIKFAAKLKRGINSIEIKVQNAIGSDTANSAVRFE